MNKNCPDTAIVVRCRNEERWIGETLERLKKQTYQNFEIIVVDSGSTDKTLEIVKEFDVTLVEIKPEEFTYPYAINVGITASTASDFYVILSAHSLPIGETWLASAIRNIKRDPQALGVYGPLLAMPDGSLTDKLFHNTGYWLSKKKMLPSTSCKITVMKGGVMGFTNALIRKDLYEQYPIDEAYAGGGEDHVWTEYWINQGYHAIKDLNFAVHHSHYLGPIGWYKQWRHWKSNATPQPFVHMRYRKDAAHAPINTLSQ